MNVRLAGVVMLTAVSLCMSARAADSGMTSSARVPLVKGLTLTGAASERQGDYESTLTVDSIDADGTLHLTTSADLPDPAGGRPKPVSFSRDVRAVDLAEGRTYKYLFTDGPSEYPGTTAMGTSAAVVRELRARGSASITLDGQPGGLAGMLTGMLAMMPGADAQGAAQGYLSATGTLQAVEPKPVPYPVIINDALVTLQAWHVKGSFPQGGEAVSVEWYILDDPANALTLRCAFGKDKFQNVRISYPVQNEAAALESALAEKRRAVIYGIYFDFNSDTIKPTSEPVLRAIAAVMQKDPDWVLNVEGHTDNVGGDARNQDLSARRAAAVKQALIARGVPAAHLNTAGYGASVPRETNATLAGRARNRRVELTRQ
ncbi:MAG TPA: OmpA family protein [Steroidobacteraceae bacterium]|jgi:outer membrane protein OmpA-like peptidoglycan-associated protein